MTQVGVFCRAPGCGKSSQSVASDLGQEAWGHLVARLLTQLPRTVPPLLVEKARSLDAFYVVTRYPDAFPAGAPAEHYGPLQSREATAHASEILTFVRTQMAATGSSLA